MVVVGKKVNTELSLVSHVKTTTFNITWIELEILFKENIQKISVKKSTVSLCPKIFWN